LRSLEFVRTENPDCERLQFRSKQMNSPPRGGRDPAIGFLPTVQNGHRSSDWLIDQPMPFEICAGGWDAADGQKDK
ncbi:MAG: hypothetical protein WCD46_10940, partial [Desulfobacterales bacterium]